MGKPTRRFMARQDAIAGQRMLMRIKRLLPLLIALACIVPILLFVLLFDKAPEEWVTETITYVRTEMVELNLSRSSGHSKRNKALATPDGRLFALFDNQVDAVLPKLHPSETCEIVYEPNFVSHQWIRSLSTEEDGGLISLDDSIARYKKDQLDLWKLMGKLLIIALLAEIPIELFWLRKNRARIAQIKAQLVKLEAREERHRQYQQNKRAGA